MLRLLQGDVGSGKTVVALLAMLHAIEAGAQAALMAPTELLARQHLATIGPLAEAAGVRIALLTGREKESARQSTLAGLASGEIGIVVGTHALLQEGVAFRDLALAVIDEQHRFGVAQRLALAGKGARADVLVMSATPIPRTLTLTAYGDLDVSRLTEKPPGRRPVDTRVLPVDRLDEVTAALGRMLASGAKAYWVCPAGGGVRDPRCRRCGGPSCGAGEGLPRTRRSGARADEDGRAGRGDARLPRRTAVGCWWRRR